MFSTDLFIFIIILIVRKMSSEYKNMDFYYKNKILLQQVLFLFVRLQLIVIKKQCPKIR